MKKLVCLVSCKGKSKEQIVKEVLEAFQNHKKHENENSNESQTEPKVKEAKKLT